MARIITHPEKIIHYAKSRIKDELSWQTLRQPKIRTGIFHDEAIFNEIKTDLKNSGYDVVDICVDIEDYKRYLEKAKYNTYSFYYSGASSHNFYEKSLEHYLSAKLLDLSSKDVFLDIASLNSPVAEIYHKLFSCETYRTDLVSSRDTKSNMFVGDAGNMPLTGGSVSKMTLHCSFEHFEGDADIRFIKEASRVLCKGGKLCMVPFYLTNRYAIQTDPAMWPNRKFAFEDDALLYVKKGYGNRFSRFYDVSHLTKRIKSNLGGLKLTIYYILNQKDVNPSCYAKFMAMFKKI